MYDFEFSENKSVAQSTKEIDASLRNTFAAKRDPYADSCTRQSFSYKMYGSKETLRDNSTFNKSCD